MNIAFVTIEGRGRIDDCLCAAAMLLRDDHLRLCGTIRALPVDHRAHRCDMDIQVLPDGPLHRISQRLGTGSRGCRLDADVIETIASEVEARLAGADLLIVNKYGRQESQGRGLCPAITRALDQGMPVLVGVNALNLPDFIRFSDGLARELSPTPEAIRAWIHETRAPPRTSTA